MFLPKQSFSQTDEFNSTSPVSLTSSTSCTIPTNGNPTYSLNGSTASAGVPAGCSAGTHYDVWFSFVAASTSETVTIGHFGNNVTNPEVQIFSGTAYANFTSQACGSTTATANSLTIGITYYIRVSNVGASPSGSGQTPKFDICLTHPTPPPSNDDCSGATTLTSATSCSSPTSGTIVNATASAGLPAGCESIGTHYDVWYKFVASNNSHTVTISGQGTSFTNPEIQLYSGTCGSLTSLTCGTTSLTSSSLTIGITYYVRISNIGSSVGSNGGFNICVTHPTPPVTVAAGRMNEVYKQTILSGSGVLQYPWEITYGPDDKLWITESRGYRVYRMDPGTGTKTTVLDLNSTSTDLSAWGADSLRAVNLTSTSNWNSSANAWPQGGLAGLAIHPKFLDGTGLYDFVYISYVHRYLSTASGSGGIFFRNKIVRFTYNSGTGKLGSPAVVCDTIPGGQDHNSQRMIIAPVTPGGPNYLFYAAGDMGSGQFANRLRPNNAQNPNSYEGKILRFNLEPISGSWIPSDNPYSTTSAVYSIGIRNNQGFAYDSTSNTLYGSSHGPYSDDEINIIEPFRNYGHPLIQGFVDGNYNGNSAQGTNTSISAGAPWTDNSGVSSCPPIGNEATNKATIDASGNGLYKDPLFSAYAVPQATVTSIWQTNPGNATPAPGWPTEAWSGLDVYTNTLIPGWKNSLVAASLKWGRLLRIRLDAAGTATAPTNSVSDTISYFNSQNRFRDLAFSPDGKDIFVIMDNSSTTSGPGSANPVVPNCAGCVQKYTFLGYNDNAGKSSIPASIDVTTGTLNNCADGTTITIDNTNNNLWVPITGADGNILAEIKANGNNLGAVTSSFYTKSGAIRQQFGKRYLHRNITITPAVQPSSSVAIRLYMTKAEFDEMDADAASGVSAITDLKILKNNDACGSAIASNTQLITPAYAEAHGANGYMLQANINSFSSFYFGTSAITLPVELVYFKGSLQNNSAVLQWETINENNASHFIVERSIDNRNFENIGKVTANGNSTAAIQYSHIDHDVNTLSSTIIYYRLKMVDADGQYKYSSIVTIALADITNKIIVSPNPATDETKLNITATKSGKATWKLIDNGGRVLKQNVVHIKKGNNNVSIPVAGLSAGLYYLQVSGAGLDQNIKFQKL
ncbi:PQQ-dependent sugar dehydrogenase [Terrimonas pollutisoli]|uniref:PQQ-dependent sugar dehydrogenase n=1 Tax=Terrimonas pollutisoli TaxID=3034147 RepID=UPI0023EC4C0B|nr:PQQ-dependent sugar dehydrogenase [Terrimonas sp. H1YJ31]